MKGKTRERADAIRSPTFRNAIRGNRAGVKEVWAWGLGVSGVTQPLRANPESSWTRPGSFAMTGAAATTK